MNDEWTVAKALHKARRTGASSMRELAARAGLSTAQISRIESGQVKQPAPATLVALARALWLNPTPLLILAGHIPDDEARSWLTNVLARGTEVSKHWETYDQVRLDAARLTAADDSAPREEIDRFAFDLFVGEPLVETEWEPSHALLGVAETDRNQRRLINLFAQITPERRERMLDALEDQVTLSRGEMHADADLHTARINDRIPGVAEA